MQSKFIKIILATIAIIFLVAGYLYLTGKTKLNNEPVEVEEIVKTTQENETAVTETSDWKTYKNEEYGFEFKYPKELKPSQSEIKRRAVNLDGDNFILNINPAKFIVAWNIKDICYQADIGNTRILEKFEVNGSNMPLCVDDSQKELLIFYRILIPKDKNQTISTVGNYFSVEAQVYGDFNIENRLKMLKQILSTFKFTD